MPDCRACSAHCVTAWASSASGTTTISNGITNTSTTATTNSIGSPSCRCFGKRAAARWNNGHSPIANTTAQTSAGKNPRSVNSPASTSTASATSPARTCGRDIATSSSRMKVPGRSMRTCFLPTTTLPRPFECR